MSFSQSRRQRFLSEAVYEDYRNTLDERQQADRDSLAGQYGVLIPAARQSFLWSTAESSLELLVLRYTAGEDIANLSSDLPSVIDAFDAFITEEVRKPHQAATLEITQLEAYVYALWLLCLCKLLGHAEQLDRVMAWIDKNADWNRDRDGLFEYVVQKLTGKRGEVQRVLLHPDVYRPLAKAIVSEPEERPALVKAFLKDWYKQMDECYWHGTHTDKAGQSSYFGYWSFEAALVTALWEIDDSSYRDHLVYPKDLVDWAREQGYVRKPGPMQPILVKTGEPAPHSGVYAAHDGLAPEVIMKQGDPLPEAEDLMDPKRPKRAFTWILRQRDDGGAVSQ